MRVLTHKLAPLFVALCALSATAGAQERAYAEPPNLKLTLTVDKTRWRPGEPAPVKARIENATGERFEIPSTVSFKADNRARDEERVTMSHGVFWSPVSLVKGYAGYTGDCQNDLSPDRVETVGGKGVVIHPAGGAVILEKGEAKEFNFDLAWKCWGHSIQSFYPSSTIFEVARRYPANSYRVYFQMQFRMPNKPGGPEGPLYHQLKSNAVEVTVN